MYAHNMQNSDNDCGIAVILTVLDQLEIKRENFTDNLNNLKNVNQQGHQGLSIQNIIDLLDLYGINSDGYSVDDFKELQKQRFPIIAFIRQDGLPHYVVIHEMNDQELVISNPTEGQISKVTISDFLKTFGDKVICIENVKEVKSNSDNFTDKLYNRVIKNITLKDRVRIVLLVFCQMLIPIVVPLIIEFLISKKIGDMTINKLLSVLLLFVPALLIFKYACIKSAQTRVELTNRIQKEVMEKYYISELEDPSFNKDISSISGYFWNLMTAINGVIQLFYLKIDVLYGVFLIITLLAISPYTVPIIAFWIIIFGLIAKKNADTISNLYSSTLTNSNILASVFQDNVKSANDINSFNKKENSFRFFQRKAETFFESNISLVKKDTEMNTLLQVFTILILLSYFVLFFAFFKIGNLKSLEGLGNGLFLVFLVTSNFQQIYSSWIQFRNSKNAISNIENQRKTFKVPTAKNLLLVDTINTIEISDLSFGYGNKQLFNDAKVIFKQGTVYGICGDNGSGKSTLISILLGLLKEQKIRVKVNDLSVPSLYNTNMIDHVSYYSTEMSTYNSTVKGNVNFSVFDDGDSGINKNQLALNLPDDYVVTGEGNNISVGQKQKILLMRTLNRDREIYVFDEPTGNLDMESTKQFIKQISLLKNKIVILVTHQEDLLAQCDVIYNLEEGAIYEK